MNNYMTPSWVTLQQAWKDVGADIAGISWDAFYNAAQSGVPGHTDRAMRAAQPASSDDARKLATAIAEAATRAGITDASEHSFSGPQLLMLLDDMVEMIERERAAQPAGAQQPDLDATEHAAKVCESRARSLSRDGNHPAANEARKCAGAIRASHWEAPAQPAPTRFGDDAHVAVPRMLLGAACSVIDKKRDGTKVLAKLRRYTTGDLSQAIAPALAAVPPVQPAPASQEDATDAARWRALLSCGRIRILGTAGVTGTGVHNPNALNSYKEPYGNYVHFGGEFWSTFPDQEYYNTKENPAYARATLTEFADAVLASQKT